MSDKDNSLDTLLELLAGAIESVDSSGLPYTSARPPHREYGPGVGPYSETVLCQRIAEFLCDRDGNKCAGTSTKRFPDLLVPHRWAIELKIARPFGDNGKEAEHWSQNLLHPYPGNTSSLADALKLMKYDGPETRAVVVVGYEHFDSRIRLDPLIESFECIAHSVMKIPLGPRNYRELRPLRHPHHQVARLWAWEVLRAKAA